MNKTWFRAATIRALKTAAQAAITAIGATTIFYEINWMFVGSSALGAAVLSYLTSISGLPEVPKDE